MEIADLSTKVVERDQVPFALVVAQVERVGSAASRLSPGSRKVGHLDLALVDDGAPQPAKDLRVEVASGGGFKRVGIGQGVEVNGDRLGQGSKNLAERLAKSGGER